MYVLFLFLLAYSGGVLSESRLRPPEEPCPNYERYVVDDESCIRTCGNRLASWEAMGACIPFTGCVCQNGYVRKYDNSTGPCIPNKECPPVPKECGLNEVVSSCKIVCTPQACDISYTTYKCISIEPAVCEPGCKCKDGYLRNLSGVCIPSNLCPGQPVNCTRPNEVWSPDPTDCPLERCEDINLECINSYSAPARCICAPGYYRNQSDICVIASECDNQQCNGDPNAKPNNCPSSCPATCARQETNVPCIARCDPSGCECKPGYILSEKGGRCIPPDECPDNRKCSDPNASPQNCPSYCQPTCGQSNNQDILCVAGCLPSGCVCNPGYILEKSDGKCIRTEDCPSNQQCSDPNSSYQPCPRSCQPTCNKPDTQDKICTADCLESSCVCNPGYILNVSDGECINTSDCPNGAPECPANKTFADCAVTCSGYCPVSDSRAQVACSIAYPCPAGCICKPGYLMLSYENPQCILSSECPPVNCTRPNEVWDPDPTDCPLERCEDINLECIDSYSAPPRCVCESDYYRNQSDICVPASECGNQQCTDPNASPQNCPSYCQPTCSQPDTSAVFCDDACLESGCVCNAGYILDRDEGTCVTPEECPGGLPECPANKSFVNCNVGCPNNYCPVDDNRGIIACDPPNPCSPGCACIANYLMLSYEDPRCILSSECPPVNCTRPNEVWDPDPTNCPLERCEEIYSDCIDSYPAPPRCVCESEYYRNQSDICVPVSECGTQCNDPNASPSPQDCPSSCQPTCARADTRNVACTRDCLNPACLCNPGYILSEKGGICVPVGQCEGGSPTCPANKTYADCSSTCSGYCPVSDSSAQVACSIASPCPAGCICKPGYLMLSYEDQRCILSSECPNVICTKPNEVWSRIPPSCDEENCEDNNNTVCFAYNPSSPRCVCKPDYCRNASGICVPAEDYTGVEQCGANATSVECASACAPTCAGPDTRDKVCTLQCVSPGCECKEGYILSEVGGQCIKPADCPGGSPTCPSNETFEACYIDCAENYCPLEDKRVRVGCGLSIPCPSGCACKPGYTKLSYEDPRCVLASECPPVNCTRPNEVYDPNPVNCESCEDINRDCNNSSPGTPRCVCEPGYYRNQSDVCVPASECDVQQCGANATSVECASACASTCADPDTRDRVCTLQCVFPGCECKEGYILSEIGGQCIKPADCPGGSPTCPSNETFEACYIDCAENYCPLEDKRVRVGCGLSIPCPSGCACKPGYTKLSYEDPRCVLASECPPVNCTRPNEVYDPNPVNCESCEDIDRNCNNSSPGTPRCVCAPGYCRNRSDVCVPDPECNISDSEQCEGDFNATRKECPNYCPATCDSPNSDEPCPAICLETGCECKPGYILSSGDGECIKPEDCPGGSPTCDENQTYVSCKFGCPTNYCPKADSRGIVACSPPNPCNPGCACNANYLMLSFEDQRCVLASECPPVNCTRPNEIWDPSPSGCYFERCQDTDCDTVVPYSRPPRCVCQQGYFRNQSDICVPASECRPPAPKCGYNETAVKCRTICPPQNCEIAYTDYRCTDYKNRCEPGCDCLPNYLRNGSGICILNDECPYPTSPICGINEIARDCKRTCPPQTCLARLALFKCSENPPCEPGCDCVANYLRNGDGVCIPAEECDKPPPKCTVSEECKRTCASPNPPYCPYEPAESNIDGCECMEGYILSDIEGSCIPLDECPSNISCNDDSNARAKRCPLPCPSTCDSPNATPCKRMCDPIACECKPGYMLSNVTGKCILPDQCPGGNPCGEYEEFRQCKTSCAYDYCPVDDSRNTFCDPPNCLSGCACKLNYRRLSYKNNTCVVASDCPPVNCTRPNEVWNECPEECFSGNCQDRAYENVTCNTLLLNCQPKCVCAPNTYRNVTDICVPASECPPLCPIPDECKRTCASPNPPNCDGETKPDDNIDGCECMDGYILSDIGGTCIPIDKCPNDVPCNGDPNARAKQCPAPCPSTCDTPEEVLCHKACEPVGCECKPGYLRSNITGQCVLPNECPNGNPCGPKGRFVACKNSCPTDYCPVDDNRGILVCEPSPTCLSGCICNLNHKKWSREDPRCTVSSDCPPVNCTRPNEIWSGCPSACLAENCADVDNQPSTCNTLVLNCQPHCICGKKFFRNSKDVCVPQSDCVK